MSVDKIFPITIPETNKFSPKISKQNQYSEPISQIVPDYLISISKPDIEYPNTK